MLWRDAVTSLSINASAGLSGSKDGLGKPLAAKWASTCFVCVAMIAASTAMRLVAMVTFAGRMKMS